MKDLRQNGDFTRLKHPTFELPRLKIPPEIYDLAVTFAEQESDYEAVSQRDADIYNFAYAYLNLNDQSSASKAAVISRDYDIPINQIVSMVRKIGLGHTLMSAKFYQYFRAQGITELSAAFACWYDLRDKLLSEDYEAITPIELNVLHDNRHFQELELPSFAPHLEIIAQRASTKEDGTDYHFKLEPFLPRLPGGLTGVPVEIRENIYNYFFGEEDIERQLERMDPEKQIKAFVSDHYLKELGADQIVDLEEDS
jgi:hypothetical protein